MNQNTEFTSASSSVSIVPPEMLTYILSYLDMRDRMQAQLVSTLWRNTAWQFMCETYNTILFPKAFAAGKLWTYVLQYHAKQDVIIAETPGLTTKPFTEDEQIACFKPYEKEILRIESGSTPLAFLCVVKARFVQRQSDNEDEEEIRFREQLLAKYWPVYEQHITDLFDHIALNRLTNVYNSQTGTWQAQSPDDIIFIQRIHVASSELESLCSACVILAKPKQVGLEWHFFQQAYVTGLVEFLSGRDLVLLSQGILDVPNIIEGALQQAIHPLDKPDSLTPEQIECLLKKLTLNDVLSFIQSDLSNYEVIVRALSVQQPRIYALFLRASDQQLCQFCFSDRDLAVAILTQPALLDRLSNESLIGIFDKFLTDTFFAAVIQNTAIVERLTSPVFFKVLADLSLWQQCGGNVLEVAEAHRSIFTKYLLTSKNIVDVLDEKTIIKLLSYHHFSYSQQIFNTLLSSQKLTLSLFLEFCKKLKASRVSSDEHFMLDHAFQLATQPEVIQNTLEHLDTDTATPLRLLELALHSQRAEQEQCPLLQKPLLIAKFSDKQLNELHDGAAPGPNQALLAEAVAERKKQQAEYAQRLKEEKIREAQRRQEEQAQELVRLKAQQELEAQRLKEEQIRAAQRRREEQIKVNEEDQRQLEEQHKQWAEERRQAQIEYEKVFNPPVAVATQIPTTFPVWSIVVIVIATIVSLALILFAALSLGHINIVEKAMQAINEYLHVPWDFIYSEIGVLLIGIVIGIGTALGVIIRKCTHTAQQIYISQTVPAADAVFSPTQVDDEEEDPASYYSSTPTQTQTQTQGQSSSPRTQNPEQASPPTSVVPAGNDIDPVDVLDELGGYPTDILGSSTVTGLQHQY